MSLWPTAAAHHPYLQTGDWWNPSTLGRMFDQDFAVGLHEDDPLFSQALIPSMAPYWMRQRTRPAIATMERGLSEVRNDGEKFSVNLDISHFKPEEVKVNVVDNNLTIEGKHEEKMDPHGFVSRSFKRRYMLPKDVDPGTLTSHLANNGILRVEAPKKVVEKPNERSIPIHFASQPAIEPTKVKVAEKLAGKK